MSKYAYNLQNHTGNRLEDPLVKDTLGSFISCLLIDCMPRTGHAPPLVELISAGLPGADICQILRFPTIITFRDRLVEGRWRGYRAEEA
jgi:hypothetical protein